MIRVFRLLLLLALIFSLLAPSGAQAANPPAPSGPTAVNAPAWYDGLIQYSTITNCFSIIQGSPYQEYGAGTFTGFRADPDNAQPAPNDVYYIHVYIAGMGNSCSGMRVYLDVSLPASTTLAIDGTHPVYCYLGGAPITPASDCPQTLPASSYNPGAYAIYSPDSAHAYLWPLPQGGTLEFQIPVKSSTALTNSTLQANVWVIDGNSSPWLRPTEGVYVFSSQPTILYPSPSTTLIAKDTAHSQAYLYTHGLGGTAYFDLGTTTSYGLIHESVIIAAGGNAFLAWDDWGPPSLTPDTLYHWRFTFTPTAGSTVFGPDQTFRTLPDGRQTVGQGASASCTEAALTTALAAATKDILFNCGLSPVTITLNSVHTISSNLIIDGGNLVTLAFSGAGNHFNVQSGAHLTLTQITLSNGNHTSGCGGAVYVASGAQLSLNKTYFDHNQSNAQGGAVCNWGATDITNTQFTNNSTSFSHGGAIGNYGTLSISNSTFSANSAAINGGAIDMGGTVTVTNSTFNGNTSNARGGGINAYGGNLTLTGSTFTANTAAIYGGGFSNDASTTTITNSTFSGNSSPNVGGGIETSGVNSLTILNSTIANNTAGAQGGGNLYVGGSANPNIHLKNTLVAGGSPNNCDAHVNSQGYNLESTNSCGFGAAGDKINQNPKLGPLQNNNGGTFTLALLAGSPAIDAGTNSGCPATDQRAVTRPIDGNHDGSAVCDIGSYESPPQIFKYFLPYARK